MANFPNSVTSFAALANGQTIQASDVGDARTEITAIEDGYINGTARLNSSNSTVANLSVAGGSSFAGTVTLASRFNVGVTFSTLSGGSTRFDNVAIGSTTFAWQVNGNSTAIAISGISGGSLGRMGILSNTGSANITLLSGNANSSADCRIRMNADADSTLATHGSAVLIHNGIDWYATISR